MAYEEADAQRIRQLFAARDDVVEKRIVGGGLGFMVAGHLCCGLSMRGLTVRVGPEAKADLLSRSHVIPLTFGGRETAAFVVVEDDGYRSDDQLAAWIKRGLAFVSRL